MALSREHLRTLKRIRGQNDKIQEAFDSGRQVSDRFWRYSAGQVDHLLTITDVLLLDRHTLIGALRDAVNLLDTAQAIAPAPESIARLSFILDEIERDQS